MVSYAEFHQMQARRTAAMKVGLRKYLGVPKDIAVYLDNGAFYFSGQGKGRFAARRVCRNSRKRQKPNWKPIPAGLHPAAEHVPHKSKRPRLLR